MKNYLRTIGIAILAMVVLSVVGAASWNYVPEKAGADAGFPVYAITLQADGTLLIENVGIAQGSISGAKVVRVTGDKAELVANVPQVCTLMPNVSLFEHAGIMGSDVIGSHYVTKVTVKTVVPVAHGDRLMLTNGVGAYAIVVV